MPRSILLLVFIKKSPPKKLQAKKLQLLLLPLLNIQITKWALFSIHGKLSTYRHMAKNGSKKEKRLKTCLRIQFCSLYQVVKITVPYCTKYIPKIMYRIRYYMVSRILEYLFCNKNSFFYFHFPLKAWYLIDIFMVKQYLNEAGTW
jgi:hypothetical protein